MERVATIPVAFRWATFDAPELSERCKASDIRDARTFIDDLSGGRVRNVAFLGPAGAGKTSLACAGLRALLTEQVGFSGRFCGAVEICAAQRNSDYGRTCVELSDAKRASLIVLDDIGQEFARDAEIITELVHSRHNESKPIIVTSWLEPNAIATRYGDGTARRILEHAAIVRVG
jgi:DNA replication protein DnaC